MSAPRGSHGAPAIAAVVLAAGLSSRMGGRNKLLARVNGAALVTCAVDAALESRAAPVVVVTGHDAEAVEGALTGRAVRFARNPDYARGLSASLRSGLAALPEASDAAVICLGDMPAVAASHVDALIDAFTAHPAHPICLPVRAGRRGNPVLWPARYFAELGGQRGDVGGRALLARSAADTLEVAMPDDAVLRDVDTPEDLRR